MPMEHCKHCQATDRAKAPAKCDKSPTGAHEWMTTTEQTPGSTPTPGGQKPFTADPGKK